MTQDEALAPFSHRQGIPKEPLSVPSPDIGDCNLRNLEATMEIHSAKNKLKNSTCDVGEKRK